MTTRIPTRQWQPNRLPFEYHHNQFQDFQRESNPMRLTPSLTRASQLSSIDFMTASSSCSGAEFFIFRSDGLFEPRRAARPSYLGSSDMEHIPRSRMKNHHAVAAGRELTPLPNTVQPERS